MHLWHTILQSCENSLSLSLSRYSYFTNILTIVYYHILLQKEHTPCAYWICIGPGHPFILTHMLSLSLSLSTHIHSMQWKERVPEAAFSNQFNESCFSISRCDSAAFLKKDSSLIILLFVHHYHGTALPQVFFFKSTIKLFSSYCFH